MLFAHRHFLSATLIAIATTMTTVTAAEDSSQPSSDIVVRDADQRLIAYYRAIGDELQVVYEDSAFHAEEGAKFRTFQIEKHHFTGIDEHAFSLGSQEGDRHIIEGRSNGSPRAEYLDIGSKILIVHEDVSWAGSVEAEAFRAAKGKPFILVPQTIALRQAGDVRTGTMRADPAQKDRLMVVGRQTSNRDTQGMYQFGHRVYDTTTGSFLQEDPIQDGTNWYEYCHYDPINYNDPSGLRAIVANDAMPEFQEWYGQNISGGLNGSLAFGFPQGSEGVSMTWMGNYTSSFSELNITKGLNPGNLSSNDMDLAAMIADPNHVYVFDKSGWRERNANDLPNSLVQGLRNSDLSLSSAGAFATAALATGLYYAGEFTEPLMGLPPNMGGTVGRIGMETRMATSTLRLGNGMLSGAEMAQRMQEFTGAGAAFARIQGLRRSIKYSQELFSDPYTQGVFRANAPILQLRSGWLGKIGVQYPTYTGGRITVRPGLAGNELNGVLRHEAQHLNFALQHPELRYLQESNVLGLRGASAFVDEILAYRAELGGINPGRAWGSMNTAEKKSLIYGTGAAMSATAGLTWMYSE